MGEIAAEDYVDWAGEMLVREYDSHSLRILAALGNLAYSVEAEQYFLRALDELHFDLPDRNTAIRGYACALVQQIVDGVLTAEEGVRSLFRICIAAEYPRELMIWYELDDALESLNYGDFPHTYPSATLENFSEIAKREAEKFLADVCTKDDLRMSPKATDNKA